MLIPDISSRGSWTKFMEARRLLNVNILSAVQEVTELQTGKQGKLFWKVLMPFYPAFMLLCRYPFLSTAEERLGLLGS